MDERLMGVETREKGTELDHGKMAGGSSSWKLMGQQSSAFLRRETTQKSPAGEIPSAEAVLLSLEKVLVDLEGQEREVTKMVIGSLEDEQSLHKIECNRFLQGFLLDQIAPLRHRLSSEKKIQDHLRSRAKEKSNRTHRLESDGGGHESEFKSQREAESVMFMGLDTITNGDKTVESDKPMIQPAYPSTNILDCGGDDKKDEMDMRKSDAYWTMKSGKLLLKPADTIGRCSVQGCPDHDEMDTLLAKEMANEAERFASYVHGWEYAWGRTCGFFRDMTVLSSMQFTHYTPGQKLNSSHGSATRTLQIFSIKLAEITGGLKWPLPVYGVVAIQDVADHNRNLLFSCNRSQAQELKEDDRVLHLIGPSRAIVFTDRVDFEIQLKVKGTGTTKSQDKRLISYANCYDGGYGPGVSTFSVSNCLCTLKFCVQTVTRTFQATVLDVQVVKDDGSWPFEYGGRFACSPLSGKFVFTDSGVTRTINPSSSQIVLLDSKDGAWLKKGCGGYLHMWRQVVSVEIEGRLDVFIQAYSKSGDIASQGLVCFIPKSCGMSHGKCALGGSEVSITVAWSLVATDKGGIAAQGNLFEC